MTEQSVPATDGGASAQTPASLTAEQISELIANGVQSAFDKRIPGLMSTFDSKVSAVSRSVDEIMRSSSDDDDDVSATVTRANRERDEALRQAAAAKAALQFPLGYQVYEQVQGMGTVEEQMAFLQEWASQAGQQTPADDDTEDDPQGSPTPPIDRNNPRREEVSNFQSDEDAERYLGQFERWPGEQ